MPDSAAPARARLHFALIFIAHALGAMSVLAVLTAGPQIVAALGLSPLQLGGLASIYSAALAAASLPAGLVTDRLGTRAALTSAAAIIATGLGLAASAQSFVHLGAGMALCGAGYGLINPAAGRAITLWFTPKWRTTLLSLKQTGVPAGAALGSVTALLGPGLGWQADILSAAILTALAGLAFFLLLPQETNLQPMAAQARNGRRLRTILTIPHLGRANLAAGLTNGLQFALWAHLAEIVHRAFSANAATLALCLGALHLGTFLGRVLWGALTDRMLRGNAAQALRLLCAVGLIGAGGLASLPFGGGAWLAVGVSFVLGFTVCAAVGLHIALTARLAPEGMIGGALGYTMLITNLGGVVVPLLVGMALALAQSTGAAVIIAALIALVVILLNQISE
ncbi:MAG: MFS transporter [Roseinatronobacter sp.]|nr:MFS transporter [Roseinatronobacter sp.]